MTPFKEVVEEKIALMAIVFFFTILGLVMMSATDVGLIIVSLGIFIFFMSLIAEVAIVAWIFISVKRWGMEKLARKERQKTSIGGV